MEVKMDGKHGSGPVLATSPTDHSMWGSMTVCLTWCSAAQVRHRVKFSPPSSSPSKPTTLPSATSISSPMTQPLSAVVLSGTTENQSSHQGLCQLDWAQPVTAQHQQDEVDHHQLPEESIPLHSSWNPGIGHRDSGWLQIPGYSPKP